MSEKKEDLRFELIMDAGNGAQKAGDILIKGLARSGQYVFIEPMIPAEISPPKRTPHSLSGVIIRVSNKEVFNIGSYTDLMVIEHEILLKRRVGDKEFQKGSTILLDMGDAYRAQDAYDEAIQEAEAAGAKVIQFHMNDDSKGLINDLKGNGKNMYYLGLLTAVFGVEGDIVEKLIRDTFKKLKPEILDKNIAIYHHAINCAKEIGFTQSLAASTAQESMENKILMDGNTAFSMGIIDSGIKVFSGYPITPASSIMHTLAQVFNSYGGIVHQAEDEISAIGAAVGAYYGNVPAITATSGPGFSLKQEFIGLATSTETPCIVVDVQRGGPSTGLPTKTEQSDLPQAIFGTHGDNTKVVFSVSTVEDCFYAPHLARYLTEKLRVPVIVLSDYMMSVTYRVFEQLRLNKMERIDDIEDFILERFRMERLPEEIEMVKENQSNPGDDELMRRITGLNTDVEGKVVYSPESTARAHKIRNEKINVVRKALKEPEIFGEKENDILIVCWGSVRGTIIEAINRLNEEGVKVSGLHFKMVNPLPLSIKEIFKRFKKVVTVELNYGDEHKPASLAMLLRSETLIDIESVLSVPTGRPIKPIQVVEKIKEMV